MTDAFIAAQARAADLAKVRRARGMTAFEKFDAGASLFEEACAWNLAGIAHQHPEWKDFLAGAWRAEWGAGSRRIRAIASNMS